MHGAEVKLRRVQRLVWARIVAQRLPPSAMISQTHQASIRKIYFEGLRERQPDSASCSPVLVNVPP